MLYQFMQQKLHLRIFSQHFSFYFYFLMLVGAQSDSELPSASVSDNFSDRGYTSDSEISYDRQMLAQRSPSPLEIRPIHDNGSWLLVKISLSFFCENNIVPLCWCMKEKKNMCTTIII